MKLGKHNKAKGKAKVVAVKAGDVMSDAELLAKEAVAKLQTATGKVVDAAKEKVETVGKQKNKHKK
ncbi:MAG: hypothetical protein HXX08_22535 [Chloroflexi bacterium]|uniref:Uncharacterized protein n=1 Tax=Candidatus Chlorohelix allophototropha TaxID=3003348 RepID=A0A8T7M906_9CHLR|nr:hypothetical protein [Chloroflexota bacterium]WJW68577.1 hypothetical protein OZ401_004191 [Chloroflexota bacterium L227-S17]